MIFLGFFEHINLLWLILLAWKQNPEKAFGNCLPQNKPLSSAGMISFYILCICLHLLCKNDLIKFSSNYFNTGRLFSVWFNGREVESQVREHLH